MKFLAFIIISASLCLGLVSAVTAYLPSLDLSDEDFKDLTLNAPAGTLVFGAEDMDLLEAARQQVINDMNAGDAGSSEDVKLAQLEAANDQRRQWMYEGAKAAWRSVPLGDDEMIEGEDYRLEPDPETGVLQRWAKNAEDTLEVAQRYPLVPPNTKLDASVLAIIRTNLESPGVSLSDDPSTYRVRVKEFSIARWDGKWAFLGSCLGLLVGAFIIRAAAASAVAAATRATSPDESPMQALHRAHDEVAALRSRVAPMTDPSRWHEARDAIVHELDRVSKTHLDAFVNARPQLVAELGMGGYAQLMDAFAAAERQLNRAWSAAADEVLEEAFICLDRGAALLEEAVKFLPRTEAAPA